MSFKMIRNESTTYNYGDYFNGGMLFDPEDSTGYGPNGISGFSNLQMKETHNGTESTLTDVSYHVVPLKTESLIDLFEAKNYGNLIETARPMCSSQYVGSINEELDTTVQLNHLIPKEETFSTGTYVHKEYQQSENQAFQLQPVNMNRALDVQSNVKRITARSGSSETSLKSVPKRSREERTKGEYNRRFAVNEKLQALHDLLPSSLKGCNRESLVENVMDHIKQLQTQLKALSASRLGGESISVPLVFLEGHGHYYQHDKMFIKSLEEVVGRLIEENPAAAQKFLESKGLYMMPIACVDALSEAE